MDQDFFRQLMVSGAQAKSSSGQPQSRGTIASQAKAKPKAINASEPAFKPRKVKKSTSQYRDRAAERRVGEGNDYAQVEAILEDFNRRTENEDKQMVEEQRRYLGGDSEHSILVKGLDMSLLEQNKARASAASGVDDDTLEAAFHEANAESRQAAPPAKRTREEMIRELKLKRQKGGEPQNGDSLAQSPAAHAVEEAKTSSRFKPIGFKPIGADQERSKKKRTRTDEKEGKKKKKLKTATVGAEASTNAPPLDSPSTSAAGPAVPVKAPSPEPEPVDLDFDIFAGAGDYEGDFGDEEEDSESEGQTDKRPPKVEDDPPPVPKMRRGWFDADDEDGKEPSPEEGSASALKDIPQPQAPQVPDEDDHEELTSLRPLQSSAIPSIREFLHMDQAAEKEEKRKARKEKLKNKKKAKKSGSDSGE
ncbi:hypothetical protein CONPUDRAFT_145450 [Coniophora puteana RWD-64-598 SS2]|uniref:RED-like N-terminal domain-containing protein n=1 Tax=Coniophora puteana (strain RWD-64-598) TaxID=741705 RepID=A0A5M3MK30_CONPW|nr:uncharacterized protein CONPUDRAFT_145450 [Coniophora puteana RWD-64-598 SS2]EIW79416.1 hypothetical protein CONPUDRAFT_145450 [Coniophora puteana RWD-64-598 SS2]